MDDWRQRQCNQTTDPTYAMSDYYRPIRRPITFLEILTWTLGAGAIMGFLMLLLGGCASLNRQVFNAERLAVDSVYASVVTFNAWYRASTNGAPTSKIESLNKTRDEVWLASRQFSMYAGHVEAMRLAWATNQNTSNTLALQLSVEALGAKASNILVTVKGAVQ